MSYHTEREEFIARMTTEGLPLPTIRTLLRCATTLHRLAELACSSEAADRDRIPCPAVTLNHPLRQPWRKSGPCLCDRQGDDDHETIPRIRLQDWQAERRAEAAVPSGWQVITQGDPRGYTLKVIPPSYRALNEGRTRDAWEGIGVPHRY